MRRCQEIWQKLGDHIYKDRYEGWYCEGCEGYVTDKEYEENNGVCPDHQKPYVKLSEENYYLRIADFKDQIREAIEKDEMKITPSFRKKEFLNQLKDMPDVSISRPKEKVQWGVPVPGDEDQVMYVWIDALANYITVLGYPDQDISDSWPADTQVIGKDILRFHAGIWPTILFALGLPLPKNLLVHGFVTVDGQKMSKSIGNVVDPVDILEKHGLMPLRYFISRHGSATDDVDFTWDKYEASYNELANDLGNLVQRLSTLCGKNGVKSLKVEQKDIPEFVEHMDKYEFNTAFEIIWGKIQELNKRIDEEKPWSLAKTDPEKAVEVLTNLSQDLINLCPYLAIFIPDTAAQIEAVFTAEAIAAPKTPLFPKN
jgi:methionyl-tRNA synthetase